MEIIQEILHLIKKEGIESSGMFDLSSGGSSLVDKYINLVLNGKGQDDDAIAGKLYGSDRSDPRYKNLKKRVKKKLIEAIPSIDREYLGFKSEYNQVYFDCMEKAHTVHLLSKISAYNTIIYIIKTSYQKAEKFQMYNVLRLFSYQLVRIYAIRGETKKVLKEAVRLNSYLKEEQNVTMVYNIYFQTIAQLVNNSNASKQLIESLKNSLDELNITCYNSSSFEVKYWTNYLNITYLILIKDDRSLIQTLNAFELIFDNWSHYPPARRTAFAIQKLSIQFQLKEYTDGLLYAEKNQHWILTHQSNWSLFKRYTFYHALNINLGKALATYHEVTSSEYFQLNNNQNTSQLWLINHAYLQFLLNYRNHPQARRFNIYKFINEVHIYSKDKAGYNFSIFVIEMMFYLLNDDIDSYMQRTTALMAYRMRHLKNKSFKRSNVFAQLLLDVEKHRFDPVKLKRSAQKKYDYLASLEDRLNINEWEIIGYETLWDIVLDLLRKRSV